MISGATASARANPTRCFIPPDSSLGYACSKPSSPTRLPARATASHRASAHCISDRHTSRFHPTTMRLISAIPPAKSGKLACAVASLIRLPRPFVVRSVPPASMYSATIDPFHAPPAAVTQPVTRAGNAAGRYSARQRARRGSRNAAAASFSCSGMAATAEITLNRMYHCPASTISATAPSPSPTPIRSNSRITSGNSMGAGNDATTWITGCSARASRGERPIHTPAGRAHTELTAPHTGRPPQQLVHAHDHQNHREDRQEGGRGIPPIECDAHVRADAGQAVVVVPQPERLVHHQEEPAPRHGQHPVPHEPLRRRGHFELPEGARRPPARDLARLAQRRGQALERVVEGQRQVPGLSREDHENRGELETDVARGEERHQTEHQPGQETEHRDALEDVEQRQEQPLRRARLGGGPAEAQGEEI